MPSWMIGIPVGADQEVGAGFGFDEVAILVDDIIGRLAIMLILGDAYDFFIGHACKAVISFFCMGRCLHNRYLAYLMLIYSPACRCRTTSYMSRAAATEALRELTWPNMGIWTRTSHVSLTRCEMPRPSLPMTRTTGSVRELWK